MGWGVGKGVGEEGERDERERVRVLELGSKRLAMMFMHYIPILPLTQELYLSFFVPLIIFS